MGDPDPEGEGEGDGHPPPLHVLGYESVGRGRYSTQQQQQGARKRTYALQPFSSSVPNPFASGPRMEDYTIRAGRGYGKPDSQARFWNGMSRPSASACDAVARDLEHFISKVK